jgi:molybdopterin-biosynthesis enzyme MoeA-like protein
MMVHILSFRVRRFSDEPHHPQDITYSSLAKSFNQGLVYHDETISRMRAMMRSGQWFAGTTNEEQKTAAKRMALFPDKAEVLFVGAETFVVRLRSPSTRFLFLSAPILTVPESR